MSIIGAIFEAARQSRNPAPESCATCRYWHKLRHVNGDMHECRRRAPIVTERSNWSSNWSYPVTCPQEWCGEYERENTSSHNTKMQGTQKP